MTIPEGPGFGQSHLSAHPTDVLIRDLIRTRRRATPEETAAIGERMASAPFEPGREPVRMRHRGLQFHGQTLGGREPSLFYHVAKRVLIDRQWSASTTESEYLGDLRGAIEAKSARHVVYLARGGHIAAAIVATTEVLPGHRRAEDTQPWLAAFYSADRGVLVSGYQASDLSQIRIPQEALWLR